ncbi:MAG: glycerol kinase [Betaproteobacteria bacterium]|nr:MAG: glycerol kinase [Betaproteobacteria bacterium]
MRYILALDQGTTSSRAIVFDREGAAISQAQREFRQIFPHPGWVEHDPIELWESQLEVAREALVRADAGAGDVAAIGIANQRETTLVWDKRTGAPVGNAIVWQDRRTAGHCDRLKGQGLEPLFAGRTGLVLDPYFSATKLCWMLQESPRLRERAERGELAFGSVDSWLVWKLTGGRVHVTDATNASRTLLFNLHTHDWDDRLLEVLDIPRQMLPRIVASSGTVAATDPALFGAAVPIAGVAGDQHAALFGQRCVRPGMVKNTYGTGCFMLMQTGRERVLSRRKLLTTVAWHIGGETSYALEGSVFVAGAIVQWLRDGLGIIESSADVEPLAASVPDNGGVYLVPALAGLGAPHWDPLARGAILGLTRGATKAHLARAALESIAFQSADLTEAMHHDSGIEVTELRVDGGAARNDLLMQFQADVLGVPVVRPRITETTALGAAYLAGLGTGFWGDPAVLDRQWQIDRTFEPRISDDQAQSMRAAWQRAIERAKQWASP